MRFTRPGVTEEYSVSVDGVRQDFVITASPSGAGDLRVELALSGARAEATAYGAKMTLDGSGRVAGLQSAAGGGCHGPGTDGALGSLSADRLAVGVADANAIYPCALIPPSAMPTGSAWARGWTVRDLCAGGERDQSLRRGELHPAGGCRPTTSPNGTAAPGRPWAQGWTAMSMRWR